MTKELNYYARVPLPIGSETHHRLLTVRTAPITGVSRSLSRDVARLINEAFEPVESYLWIPGTTRTDANEIADLIHSRSLLIAEVGGELAGCVAVELGTAEIGRFFMLAVAAPYRRRGIAEQLVNAAEKRASVVGHDMMQLEVLGPQQGTDVRRQALVRRYESAGYSPRGTVPFEREHAYLASKLVAPGDLLVMHKSLRAQPFPGSLGRSAPVVPQPEHPQSLDSSEVGR